MGRGRTRPHGGCSRSEPCPGHGERRRDGGDLARRARRRRLGEERRRVDALPSEPCEAHSQRGRQHVGGDRARGRRHELHDARELPLAIPAERLDRGARHPRGCAVRIGGEDDRRRRPGRDDDGRHRAAAARHLHAPRPRREECQVGRGKKQRAHVLAGHRRLYAPVALARQRGRVGTAHGFRTRNRGTVTSGLTSSKTTSTGRPISGCPSTRFETRRTPGASSRVTTMTV